MRVFALCHLIFRNVKMFFFFNPSAHIGTNILLHDVIYIGIWHQYFVAWNQITSCWKNFSIHVRETSREFNSWIQNYHTRSAFSFLRHFSQLGLAQLSILHLTGRSCLRVSPPMCGFYSPCIYWDYFSP